MRCRPSLPRTSSAKIWDRGAGRYYARLSRDLFEKTDTVFNSAYIWDSYRGAFNPGILDFRRVAIHEFGHTLGLDHPDQHGQNVAAIMNSHIGDFDTVQADDIAGAEALYAEGPPYQFGPDAPVLKNLSTRGFVGKGDNIMIGGFIVQGSQPATRHPARDRPLSQLGRHCRRARRPNDHRLRFKPAPDRDERRLVHQRQCRDDRQFPPRSAEQPRIRPLSYAPTWRLYRGGAEFHRCTVASHDRHRAL